MEQEFVRFESFPGYPGTELAYLYIVVHGYVVRRHEARYAELMVGLRLYAQGAVGHADRQMERSVHRSVRQFGIEYYSRDIDMVIDGVREIDVEFASHRFRGRVDTSSGSV